MPPRAPQAWLWAPLGAVSTAVILWAWTGWILSPELAAIPTGPDTLGGAELAAMRLLEVTTAVAAIYILGRFLVGPLVRERTLSFEGMLVIAMFLMAFFDPFDNYLVFSFTYSAHFIELGAWSHFVPGWHSPNGERFGVPLLFAVCAYVGVMFGNGVAGVRFLRWLGGRRPSSSLLGRFAALVALFAVVDFAFENLLIRLGFMAYPGVPHALTLWAGEVHQFPLYEPLLMALWWTGMTVALYFRDPDGRSFAQRGVAGLPRRTRAAVSVFAITGFLHLWTLAVYFLPFNALAVTADSPPALPSHLRKGICGAGTQYACPGGLVPVPSRDSLAIPPDDPRLPDGMIERQDGP